jgi:phosphate transport system protein
LLRVDYHEALDSVRRDLIQLGALTNDALHHSIRSFREGDTATAGRIVADDQMDAVRRKIETACVELLWRQQPLAGELREVTAIHEIAIDLGIIAGHVNEIAKQAIRIASVDLCPDTHEAHKVADLTEAMLRDAMGAFELRDIGLAQSVYARASVVEECYTPAIESIQGQMQADPGAVGCGVALLFVLSALQRVSERAENIAWHAEEMI